jgi:hypothetical protein
VRDVLWRYPQAVLERRPLYPPKAGHIHTGATRCTQVFHSITRSSLGLVYVTTAAWAGGRPATGPPVAIPGLVTMVSTNEPDTGVVGLWYW